LSFVFELDFEYCQHIRRPAVGLLNTEKKISQVMFDGGRILGRFEN
jgi:hypothetical protein